MAIYCLNGLQLNPDKSEALIVGTSSQLKQMLPAVPSLTVAGVNLPVSEQIKVLGVILDRRLTFQKHATAVAKSCNYHAQAIHHIRHLLTPELAQTLACSLILSRIDYCNAFLYSLRPAPSRNFNMCRTMQLESCTKCKDDPRHAAASQPALVVG